MYCAPDFHRWYNGYLWIPIPRARRRNWFGTSDFQIDPIQQIHFQTDFCFVSCYFGFCVQLQPDYSHYLDWFPLDLRSEEHTSELQSRGHLVCRLLLEIK